MESVRTVYVPVVVYIPVNTESDRNKNVDESTNHQHSAGSGSIILGKHKSPIARKIKKIGQLKSVTQNKRKSGEIPKRARTSENYEYYTKAITSVCETHSSAKSSSCYYQSAFISNPCEQLFGPQSFDLSQEHETSKHETEDAQLVPTATAEHISNSCNGDSSYIPTPRWSKSQTMTLEEQYRKGRFPKAIEIKAIAQELKVMDSDVEEWFRKRRGRDRKTRRKNDTLKSLIDNYLDN